MFAAVAGFGYSVVLPFDYTKRVSFANWQYFGPCHAAFTAAFALGLGWVVTLQVHAMHRTTRKASTGAARPRRGGPARTLATGAVWPGLIGCLAAFGYLGWPPPGSPSGTAPEPAAAPGNADRPPRTGGQTLAR